MKKFLELTKEWYIEVTVSYCERTARISITGNRALLLGMAIIAAKVAFWLNR